MSTEVKNIVVALKARIGNFKKKMTGAGKSFGGFMKRVGGGMAKFAKVGGIVGGVAIGAAVGIGVLVSKLTSGMDATGKLADRLGMTTESLTAMHHAAGLAGTSREALNKSLEGYTRRLGDALAGTGTAKTMLDQLGLSADKLARIPLDQQMGKIADSIAKLPTQAERASAANALFGKSGVQMVTMLQQGGAAMRDSMAEAERLGLTYNRSSAAMAENVQDSLTRIKAVFVGAGRSILVSALPVIEKVSAGFSTFSASVFPKIKAGFSAVVRGLVIGFMFAEVVIRNWKSALVIYYGTVTLAGVRFFLGLKHWFTVALPAYLSWFGRNWGNLWTDMWNFIKIVIPNMWNNISGFFKGVWSWLKGDGFDFKWTGLLDGFEATVAELPKIAKRAKTAIEINLETDIAKAKGNIADSFKKKLAERMAKLEKSSKEAVKKTEQAAKVTVATVLKKKEKPKKSPKPKKAKSERGSSFAILGRAMSLSALAVGQDKKAEEKVIAANTAKSADSLSRIEKKMSSSNDSVTWSWAT